MEPPELELASGRASALNRGMKNEMIFSDLAGRRALVTGASSGLGAHFARLLAERGAVVTLAARRLAAVTELAAQLERAEALRLDVADAAAVRAALAGRAFDIVINNAGISGGGAALTQDADDFGSVIDTNLKGVFHVAQAAAAAMVAEGRKGTIVNIASILGSRVAGHVAAYAASKAGVIQLTRALALEWARHGIRVNALCPGYIETPINQDFFASPAGEAMIRRIPQRRLGRAEDLDGALLLLCSDAGAYITGTALTVDGGHTVSSL